MDSDHDRTNPPESRDLPVEDLAEAAGILESLAADPDSAPPADRREDLESLRNRAVQWNTERVLQEFQGLACTITAHLDFRSLVRQILEAAVRIHHAERGILFLGRDDEAGLIPILALNMEGKELTELTRVSQTVLRRARDGEILLIDDAGRDERFRDLPSMKLSEIRSVLCAPLRAPTGQVGVIYLDSPSAASAFNRDAALFLKAFADLAAVALENARIHGDLQQENSRLRRIATVQPFEQVITSSPRMEAVLRRAAVAAQADVPVLITGENGTGKELLARSIRAQGPRAFHPFVPCNCLAVPRDLLESLLFGHFQGTLPGVQRDLPGLLREADRGTLYVSEIGEMDDSAQGRLLRALESGVVRPVGSRRGFQVDVRIVTASSRDVRHALQQGRFREDLFHHLSTLELYIPPLRDRREDIPTLVQHFLTRHALDRVRGNPVSFDSGATEYLQSLPWPGNVRELENLVRRVLILSERSLVDADQVRRLAALPVPPAPVAASGAPADPTGRVRSLVEQERDAIQEALLRTNGNKSKAARLLGLHRNTLMRKMQKLQIARGRPRKSRGGNIEI